MPGDKIRIVIVDDHPAVLRGLKSIFDDFDDLEVVDQAETGEQAVRMCQQQQPHVVLMDLAMPHMDGLEATKQVKAACPACQVLILTSFDQDEFVVQALDAGAIGYLVKNAGVTDMVNAVRAARAGKRSLSPEALEGLIRVKTSPDSMQEPLSDREKEVLLLITRGLSNPQIASELSLSLSTVKFHIGSLYKKLNVYSRAEAVTKAFEQHLVDR